MVSRGVFGQEDAPIFNSHWKEFVQELKKQITFLNNSLGSSEYLVGDKMTLADVIVATMLIEPLQTELEEGYRKGALKNAGPWIEKIYKSSDFVSVFGNIKMCAKAIKPTVLADPEQPKEEKKPKEAAAPAKKEEKEVKKLDNVDSLPPTSFVLYDFKTFFVNHKDMKKTGVDEMYKMLDWEGWSFLHMHYDIYEGEGAKIHITNNLMNGFLSRAEHTTKYTFGRMAVLGKEPNLQIMGVWLVRGQEVPDGLAKEHPQFEYYKTKKLDPRNKKEDDKLVREYFGGKVG